MPLTPTRRQLNWSAVSFTPTGSGTPIVLDGVTNISADTGTSLLKFSGDDDRYNSLVVNDFNDPTFTVTCANTQALLSLGVGTTGSFTATWLDAKNRGAAGGGALTFTIANAVLGGTQYGGAHRQFSSNTITIASVSADGQTPPMSYAAA